jgi:hypothetical protein
MPARPRGRRLEIVEDDQRRTRLRSFVIGGIVGGAAGLAAGKLRARRAQGRRAGPAGLAAFEEAPCFRELVEEQREPAQR